MKVLIILGIVLLAVIFLVLIGGYFFCRKSKEIIEIGKWVDDEGNEYN